MIDTDFYCNYDLVKHFPKSNKQSFLIQQ